ncbi:MAG: hypothetical protein MGU50_13580 [Trichodesmium sp. MAG_R02]|jgi:hypothetical protein|nr:hypothetical protein [Trichodesmium sp. MAG_R02]
MQNYTPMILPVLLLLGNTSSSQARMANELEFSKKSDTPLNDVSNDHGKKDPLPPSKRRIRRYYNEFVNAIDVFGVNNEDLIPLNPHRGSRR